MTLDEALAFRLPGGKTIGDATVDDWSAAADFYDRELERIKAIDPETMTRDQVARFDATLERHRDYLAAMALVREWVREGQQRKAR